MDNNTYSNIITPPDFATDNFRSVLLIDADISEIENLALFLKTATVSFNVYVYNSAMNNDKWLMKALKRSNAVIINTIQNEGSVLKDNLAAGDTTTFHYGPKNFLMNKNQISKPIDYFVSYISQITQQGAAETNGI